MDSLKIKHRLFTNITELSEDTYKGEYKNKIYFIRKFEPKSIEGEELITALKEISISGVKAPKLYWIDKKLGYAVSEYVDGELVMNYLSKNDLTEELYEQLFTNAYFAKVHRLTLNYEIDKWMIKDGTLYYIYPMVIVYQKEKDLIERYVRLWFNSKELLDFMSKHGVFYDKNRVKGEYLTNKEIVLMTCKYYR